MMASVQHASMLGKDWIVKLIKNALRSPKLPLADETRYCDETCRIAPPSNNEMGICPSCQLAIFDLADVDSSTADGEFLVPQNVAGIFAGAYEDAGARVVTTSWGSVSPYDDMSASLDRWIYEQPDSVVCIAVGNEGSSGDVGSPANAKNGISIGAAETKAIPDTLAAFSTQGPTRDTRFKPDVVAPGDPLWSVEPSSESTCVQSVHMGTSFAAPATAGAAVLLREYLIGGHHKSSTAFASSSYDNTRPSSALIKALMVASARQLQFVYNPSPANVIEEMVSGPQGFGHIYLSNAFAVVEGDSFETFLFEYDLEDNSTWEISFVVNQVDASSSVNIALVWTDPPSPSFCDVNFDDDDTSSECLVHDLDLVVLFDGIRLFPNGGASEDRTNNVEKVEIGESQMHYGSLVDVQVTSGSLAFADTQTFALVVIGPIGPTSTAPTP